MKYLVDSDEGDANGSLMIASLAINKQVEREKMANLSISCGLSFLELILKTLIRVSSFFKLLKHFSFCLYLNAANPNHFN